MSYGGFSWKRALGITSAKRKIAKAAGIPTTKAGRKRKAQTMMWNAIFAKTARRAAGRGYKGYTVYAFRRSK